MAVVTQVWSDFRQETRGATLAFDVSDVSTGNEAETAVAVHTGYTINSAFEFRPAFKCDGISTSRPSFTMWRVTLSFSEPQNGDEHTDTGQAGNSNPTSEPAIIEWAPGSRTEPIEREASDNKPILNSARSPFNPQASDEFPVTEFSITRWENAPFDAAGKIQFMGKVNASAVTFEGHVYAAGTLLCRMIAPVEPYTSGSQFVKVRYSFAYDPDGFKLRLMDIGTQGWVEGSNGASPQKAEICFPNGNQVSAPVPLNGKGKPINTTLKGKKADGTLATLIEMGKLAWYEIEDAGEAVFLVYTTKFETDFSAMGL